MKFIYEYLSSLDYKPESHRRHWIELFSNFKIPKIDLTKQNKIADFLSSIDILIEKQEEFIELIKKKIKYTTNTSLVHENYEKIKLEQILSIPKKNKAEIIDDKKILRLKLHKKGIDVISINNTLDINSTNYYIRKQNQLIYGKQNIFNGSVYVLPPKYDGYMSSGDVPSLDIDNKVVNIKYLEYFLSQKYFYRSLEKYSSGTGSKRLHENGLLQIKIQIPSLKKQNKIAKLLSTMDILGNNENSS